MARRLLVLALALPLAGCATKRDVRDLRDEIAALREAQAAALEKIQQQNAQVLDTLRVQDLRMRGDLANQLVQIQRELAHLQELTGQGQQRLAEIAERQRTQATVRPEDLVAGRGGAEAGDADELFAAAEEALERGSLTTARAGFEEFVTAFPQHPRAPEAQLGVALTYEEAEEWQAAVAAYGRVLELFPAAPQAPTALLRAAEVEAAHGTRDRARALLNQLVAAYPGSPEATRARERLKALR